MGFAPTSPAETPDSACFELQSRVLEPGLRIELRSDAYKATVLPLNYTGIWYTL